MASTVPSKLTQNTRENPTIPHAPKKDLEDAVSGAYTSQQTGMVGNPLQAVAASTGVLARSDAKLALQASCFLLGCCVAEASPFGCLVLHSLGFRNQWDLSNWRACLPTCLSACCRPCVQLSTLSQMHRLLTAANLEPTSLMRYCGFLWAWMFEEYACSDWPSGRFVLLADMSNLKLGQSVGEGQVSLDQIRSEGTAGSVWQLG